jgi:hypothetical protein
MAVGKVNHNVFKVWSGTGGAMTAAGGAAPTLTSDWLDCSGWTDKRVSFEQDNAGTPDLDVFIQISPQGHYELNNKTVTTDDYEQVTLASAHSGVILASVDAEDVDELQRPFRSARFVVDNDSATAVTEFNLWFEGWS